MDRDYDAQIPTIYETCGLNSRQDMEIRFLVLLTSILVDDFITK